MSNNPLAFPSPMIPEWSEGASGMSLRDWFAAQAIGEAFRYASAHPDNPIAKDLLPEEWAARIAYSLAEAMLAEREAA